ncbi:cytochrome P450 1A2-like [Oppia nitens]|uniref:cytochrome P450 1A2-like n=1 Tax=Oppia nitens TaxID=1686743 RepID=UPI0023D9CFE7|nr:cytochrome P450 1A2-like [Oppia nitens]
MFWTSAHIDVVMRRLAKKYGPVFTVYVGHKPQVIVADITIANTLFKQKNYSGRPTLFTTQFYTNENMCDIATSDYDERWAALRLIGHKAIVNYSRDEKLAKIISDCVDTTIRKISQKESNKPFKPNTYLFDLTFNIIAKSLFKKSIPLTDSEYDFIKYYCRDINNEFSGSRILLDLSPLFGWLFPQIAQKFSKAIIKFNQFNYEKLKLHYLDSDRGGDDGYESVVQNYKLDTDDDDNDFCDAIIKAKRDGLRDNKQWSKYLTDRNLGLMVSNMFDTGVATMDDSSQWLLLWMTYYPQCQQLMRQEISEIIGDQQPRHSDRYQCHYVMAFIAEMLRYMSLLSFYHKTLETTKIEKYTVPKNTIVLLYLGHVMREDSQWGTDGHSFRPERFIDTDTGHYTGSKCPQLIPYSVGLRKCVAEKLANATLFIICVRLLQSTKRIELADSQGISPDPLISDRRLPRAYKIVIEPNI